MPIFTFEYVGLLLCVNAECFYYQILHRVFMEKNENYRNTFIFWEIESSS